MKASEKDLQALDLRRAGISAGRIASELGVSSPRQVNAMVFRALGSLSADSKVEEVRALELDRLDRLLQGVWVRAARGELAAVDRVMALSAARLRLVGAPEAERRMRRAFEASLESLTLEPTDQALVESGRLLCDQLDATAASGDAATAQKTLYLIPHLVNVLRDLGATPAAREAVAAEVQLPQVRENELAAFKAKRKTTA